MDMTSYFSGGCSDLDEIQQPDAEWYADYSETVEIEAGSRIPIWRTFVFKNRKELYLSREVKYVDKIWFADRLKPSEGSDINKYETGSGI